MKLARLVLITAAALALAAAPAAAKKDKPDLGKLETGTATVTSPTTGTFTAIAQCPKGTKVVGGGFVLSAPSTTQDFLNPLESRREGNKAWVVSAYRVDAAGNGPAFTITAEAYCRSGLEKLSERSETETILGTLNIATPNPTCPVGKSALAGGFSLTGPAMANSFHNYLYDSLMTGGVGWVMRSVNFASPPSTNTYTGYVYCQKKRAKAPKTVSGASAVATPAFSVGAADTASCSGKRDAFAGGFQLTQILPGGVILIVTESRHVGKAWHVAATRIQGSQPAGVTAHGYCS
jgi:hypothetical protein